MHVISEPGLWRAHGESVWDVQDWLSRTSFNWKDKDPLREERHHGRNWTLGHSYDDVMRLAREGWEDGVRTITAALRSPVNENVRKWRRDMAGEMPDVPRYLSGDPRHMRRRGHDTAHRPIVSIFVNNWINAIIKAERMVNFGAAMVALIDRIESTGKRVEVVVGTVAPNSNMFYGERRVMSATWTVKHAEDPLDLSALAFSLAHPGASRRFGWAVWAHSDKASDTGYGMAMNWMTKPEHMIDPSPNLLIIPGINGQPEACATFEAALPFVAEQLNAAALAVGQDTVVDMEDLA